MKFGLSENIINKIISVFEKYEAIEEVVIYGSRAKGNFRNGSDIDITLKGEKLNFDFLTKIEIDIEDLDTPYFFDISIFDNLDSIELVEHINRVGLVFYQKK